MRAHALDRRADLGLLMRREVVEHHDVARPEGGHKHLFDVGEETCIIDRAVEDRGSTQAIESERRDDCVHLPVTARRVILKSRPAQASAIATQQIGCDAAFIEKDVLVQIAERLPLVPSPSFSDDVGTPLFVGVYGFF